MRLIDIAAMATHNLQRRRARTALNLLGIVLGTVIILMTSAGGDGIKQALRSIIKSSEHARQIHVHPDYQVDESLLDKNLWKIDTTGIGSERHKRLEKALKDDLIQNRFYRPAYMKMLDTKTIERIRRLGHVDEVVARADFGALIHGEDRVHSTNCASFPPDDRNTRKQIVAGQTLAADDHEGVLLHEVLAYRMGAVSQEQLNALIGKTVIIEMRSGGRATSRLAWAFTSEDETDPVKQFDHQTMILSALRTLFGEISESDLTPQQKQLLQAAIEPTTSDDHQEVTTRRQFIVRGVFHSEVEEEIFDLFRQFIFRPRSNLYFQHEVATDLQANVIDRDAFHAATVRVDSYSNLEDVEKEIKKLGFRTTSARGIFSNVDNEIDRICRIVFYVALGVLAIAALGISNTLVISVLERTPEFGIMKSLGARDCHILMLMLIEGTLLGMVGAFLAVAISFLVAFAGQGLLRQYVEGRVNDTISGDLFAFSPLAIAMSFGLAILICSLASILPAWRAARLDPIVAMRRS